MRIRADIVISFLILTVLLGIFVFVSSSITLKLGLSSADDGFFALVAKSFAMGAYGLPLSSNEVSLFDPYVGSGPVLIGIGALTTYMLGPQDSLGLLTLIIFVLQLFLMLLVLSRQYTWAPILGATFTGLFLLMLISGKQWYFGTFIGEVPAFGFVLLGTVLLGLEQRRSWLVAGGILFAMAYLTKQISLFAVMGVILSWYLYMAANTDTRRAFNGFMVVIGSMAMLPLLYEGAKLITLGLDGYLGLLGRTIEETARMAIGEGDNRLLKFLDVISDNYGPIWLVVVVMFLFMVTLAQQVLKNNKLAIFPLMLWSGAFSYFIYIAIASTMMPRYFWIGAAILVFAFGATVLVVGTFVRWSQCR